MMVKKGMRGKKPLSNGPAMLVMIISCLLNGNFTGTGNK
jgi:hypothetical protein